MESNDNQMINGFKFSKAMALFFMIFICSNIFFIILPELIITPCFVGEYIKEGHLFRDFFF